MKIYVILPNDMRKKNIPKGKFGCIHLEESQLAKAILSFMAKNGQNVFVANPRAIICQQQSQFSQFPMLDLTTGFAKICS